MLMDKMDCLYDDYKGGEILTKSTKLAHLKFAKELLTKLVTKF
jgi:hypothetical protein